MHILSDKDRAIIRCDLLKHAEHFDWVLKPFPDRISARRILRLGAAYAGDKLGVFWRIVVFTKVHLRVYAGI